MEYSSVESCTQTIHVVNYDIVIRGDYNLRICKKNPRNFNLYNIFLI